MKRINNFDLVGGCVEFSIELLRTFLAIIDSGGFTAAGDVVHRTQSAISMQMKRLEETVGNPLFERNRRELSLTAEGEMLLPYARRMLKLHEETVAAMRRPDMVGVVRIGAPDDFAQRFLPEILSRFASTYPRVQVTVRCESSAHLTAALDRGDIDLALLTCDFGFQKGETVRREPTVWVASGHHLIHEEDPLPLAMFQADCILRDWMFEALDGIGRDYRVAYQSPSIAGILAAVSAGLAVTIFSAGIVSSNLRVLGEAEGFPPLPETALALRQASAHPSPAVETMARYIREGLRNSAGDAR